MREQEAQRREAEYARQQAAGSPRRGRFIERFKTHVAKAAQVQSRIKKLEKVEMVAEPRRIVEKHFEFRAPPRSGDDVIKLAGIARRTARGRAQRADLDGPAQGALGGDGRERRRQVDLAADDRRGAVAGWRRGGDRRVGDDGLLRAAR